MSGAKRARLAPCGQVTSIELMKDAGVTDVAMREKDNGPAAVSPTPPTDTAERLSCVASVGNEDDTAAAPDDDDVGDPIGPALFGGTGGAAPVIGVAVPPTIGEDTGGGGGDGWPGWVAAAARNAQTEGHSRCASTITFASISRSRRRVTQRRVIGGWR